MELPLPLLHIMKDIRIEQLEEQKKQIDQQQNSLNNSPPGVVPTAPSVNPVELQDLANELS